MYILALVLQRLVRVIKELSPNVQVSVLSGHHYLQEVRQRLFRQKHQKGPIIYI